LTANPESLWNRAVASPVRLNWPGAALIAATWRLSTAPTASQRLPSTSIGDDRPQCPSEKARAGSPVRVLTGRTTTLSVSIPASICRLPVNIVVAPNWRIRGGATNSATIEYSCRASKPGGHWPMSHGNDSTDMAMSEPAPANR
jgi:hypothetical protein